MDGMDSLTNVLYNVERVKPRLNKQYKMGWREWALTAWVVSVIDPIWGGVRNETKDLFKNKGTWKP